MTAASSPRQRVRAAPPLDRARLDRLALRYVERYATSRARLAAYLVRKLRERGWEGCEPPEVEALVERVAALGYVDDAAFATARSEALGRRGFGARRVDQALYAAGIGEADGEAAREGARTRAWEAALTYARRRRIGPHATAAPDPAAQQKALAAMLRAGHGFEISRAIIACAPGDEPDAPN